MDTMTLTLNHASVPAVLYGSPSPQVWLCLHGKGGRKEEAESLRPGGLPQGLAGTGHRPAGHGARSGGPELFTPWHAVPELRDLLSLSGQKWNRLALRARQPWGPGSPCWPFRTAPWTEPSSSPRCWTWSA